jgi:hypothetical protein
VDLGYSGNLFTWSNKHKGHFNIKERLDRGLSNHRWIHLFPNAKISHLPALDSDHNPLLFSTLGDFPSLPKPFKFEAFWVKDISSHSVIANAWNSPFNGSAPFALSKKIKASKVALKIWNSQHFGNIRHNIKKLLVKLNRIQCSPVNEDSQTKEDQIQLALEKELIRE